MNAPAPQLRDPSAAGALAALFRPVALRSPLRLTTVSAWVEHIPFALNLVDLVRPRRLVELGTHAGDSYCAFCQGVTAFRLDTLCYAVDTWRGDPQAGTYGDEVLTDLRRHHDPLYGAFSRLVQSTFDDAQVHFADGSIDLLHIDGLHTFDAAQHDFETWRSKLAPGAVVLFHDTNVREGDFGVWKLWRELASSHRWSFEFPHGHGLGVLAPEEPPDVLRPLFQASQEEQVAIREVYAQLGHGVERERQLRASLSLIDELRHEIGHRESEVTELRADISRLEERERALTQQLHEENLA